LCITPCHPAQGQAVLGGKGACAPTVLSQDTCQRDSQDSWGMQALSKIQFTPPLPFVMACATFLLNRLDAFVVTNGNSTGVIDVGIITRIMSSLAAFNFDPPAALLALVRSPALLASGLCNQPCLQ
jgi:hypothetical protein